MWTAVPPDDRQEQRKACKLKGRLLDERDGAPLVEQEGNLKYRRATSLAV